MFTIQNIDSNTFDKAKEFLLSVPTIKDVDDEILNRATIVLDDENIVGAISYEIYSDIGLIRYFVFKKILNETFLSDLFENMEFNAKQDNINKILCIVNDKAIEGLFSGLGFVNIDKENLYIDEEPFMMHEYKNSNVMIKEI